MGKILEIGLMVAAVQFSGFAVCGSQEQFYGPNAFCNFLLWEHCFCKTDKTPLDYVLLEAIV